MKAHADRRRRAKQMHVQPLSSQHLSQIDVQARCTYRYGVRIPSTLLRHTSARTSRSRYPLPDVIHCTAHVSATDLYTCAPAIHSAGTPETAEACTTLVRLQNIHTQWLIPSFVQFCAFPRIRATIATTSPEGWLRRFDAAGTLRPTTGTLSGIGAAHHRETSSWQKSPTAAASRSHTQHSPQSTCTQSAAPKAHAHSQSSTVSTAMALRWIPFTPARQGLPQQGMQQPSRTGASVTVPPSPAEAQQLQQRR
jgi:hypothetical protein